MSKAAQRRHGELRILEGMDDETSQTAAATPTERTMLLELIAALDRRLPHPERAAESRIAEDAAALRSDAVQRVSDLSEVPDPAGEGVPVV